MNDGLGSPQSALVLGGTSDIAMATVRRLVAGRSRTVVLAGRRPDKLEEAGSELRQLGAQRVEAVAFDADDTASHAAFVEDVFARFGDIDVVLVAFGVLGSQAEVEADPDAAVALLRTNFVGAASVGLHVATQLRRQGHGTIVVLSSVAGERARRSNFVYGASKAGLDAFAQGLGDALAPAGVRVVVVRPGFVHTRMTAGLAAAPLATTPDKVADAVVAAVARGSHTVWAPAPLRLVMAILRHLPRPIFRRLPI